MVSGLLRRARPPGGSADRVRPRRVDGGHLTPAQIRAILTALDDPDALLTIEAFEHAPATFRQAVERLDLHALQAANQQVSLFLWTDHPPRRIASPWCYSPRPGRVGGCAGRHGRVRVGRVEDARAAGY